MTLDFVQRMIIQECIFTTELYKSEFSEFEFYFLGRDSNEIPKSKYK